MIAYITKYAAFVVPLSTAICLAYLFGFWGQFDINVLEFIGLADVVRLSLYPLVLVVAVSLVSMVVNRLSVEIFVRPAKKWAPGVNFMRFLLWGFLACQLGAVVYAFTVDWEPMKWIIFAGLLGCVALILANTEFMKRAVAHTWMRYMILYVTLSVPALAFAFGRGVAFDLKNARGAPTVEVGRLPASLNLEGTAEKPVMYAGRIGDRLAFFETVSGEMVLVREDQVPALPLRPKPPVPFRDVRLAPP